MFDLEQDYYDVQNFTDMDDMSRSEFLMSYVFGIFTYDGDVDQFAAYEIVDICRCISRKEPDAYWSRSKSRLVIYTLLMNISFFDDNTSYGTSIRYPWWKEAIRFENSITGQPRTVSGDDAAQFFDSMYAFLNKG